MNINKGVMKNLSKKLYFFLKNSNYSVLQVAKLIPEIKYQTLKRMLDYNENGTLPNINSINSLASFLNCTASELLSDSIKISAKVYQSMEDIINCKSPLIANINIPIALYEELYPKELFIISNNSNFLGCLEKLNKQKDFPFFELKVAGLFVKTTRLEYDGFYIIKKNESDKIEIINILNVSTKYATIKDGENNIVLNIEDIEVIAKFITYVILIKKENNLIFSNDYVF